MQAEEFSGIKPVAKCERVKIAVIGCGAVSERCHLPALAALDAAEVRFLVERDTERGRQLAKRFNVPTVTDDYQDICGRVDAAVLALPHYLHEPVGIALLKRGIHVLVEKPMAMTSAGCRAMLTAATEGDAILAVGHMRRFLFAAAAAKEIIAGGLLGEIRSFDFREGNVYNWPVHTDFFFRRETAGGGVLLDTGAHTLDLLIWWLGDVSLERYCDDNYGGVEADCEIRLATAAGATGFVELSRTRNLRNTAIIRGELGTLEVGLRTNELRLTTAEGRHALIGSGTPLAPLKHYGQSFAELFAPQIADFISAVQSRTAPRVPGTEAAKSVALIETCYRSRQPLAVPGLAPERPKGPSGVQRNRLSGQTVLVTGATGFVGGRLVERLVLEYGAKVKALVRDFKNASRIARFPVEMISGDIVDKQAVLAAAEGCRFIFHCAYDFAGSRRHREEAAVKGTENVCQAALKYDIDRLIHVSTFSVYGQTPDGDLDEASPRQASEDIYTRTKRAAEDLVLAYCTRSGLPAAVVQPTIVYGPHSRPWTIGPLAQLKKGRVALVDGGTGLCNAVYIDDVIEGMLLAAVAPGAAGEVFLISGREPVSWKAFYNAYETALGAVRTVSLTDKEIERLRSSRDIQIGNQAAGTFKSLLAILKDQVLWEKIYNVSGIKRRAAWIRERFPRAYDHAVTNTLGLSRAPAAKTVRQPAGLDNQADIILPDPTREALLRSQTRVRIDKAQKILGYRPRYSIEAGMAVTRAFLEWGSYLT